MFCELNSENNSTTTAAAAGKIELVAVRLANCHQWNVIAIQCTQYTIQCVKFYASPFPYDYHPMQNLQMYTRTHIHIVTKRLIC